MMIHSPYHYGRSAANLIEQSGNQGIEGARALMESFYYAFNQRDLGAFKRIWAHSDFIQLNNPLGVMLRGAESITHLYEKLLRSNVSVWVELSNIVEYQTSEMVVFAGRETGEFTQDGVSIPLSIRTSRVVQWIKSESCWRQVHHHGSIDDPRLLSIYQTAVQK
jgi:hypothetical protein